MVCFAAPDLAVSRRWMWHRCLIFTFGCTTLPYAGFANLNPSAEVSRPLVANVSEQPESSNRATRIDAGSQGATSTQEKTSLRDWLFAYDSQPAIVTFGVGSLGVFDDDPTLNFSIDFRFAIHRAWFQPRVFATWATDGSRLAGAGLLLNREVGRGWRVTIGFGPGYYERNRGRNLGSSIEFLSTFEISRRLSDGLRGGVTLEHISNGSISNHNPGTETIRLFLSVPFDR